MLVSEYWIVALSVPAVAARAAPASSAVRGRGFEPIRRAAARSQAIEDGLRMALNLTIAPRLARKF
ncbi:MAG: hypothetical protein D4R66_08445 [Opitutales bacterium]|nr:MAG: hypothetical protein D4R66_08445 [Opitutales bacterium]